MTPGRRVSGAGPKFERATSHCSAYDCEFVALALELEVPLVTADRQLLRSFPRIAVPFPD